MVPGGRYRKLSSPNKILTRLILCAYFPHHDFLLLFPLVQMTQMKVCQPSRDHGLYTIKKEKNKFSCSQSMSFEKMLTFLLLNLCFKITMLKWINDLGKLLG